MVDLTDCGAKLWVDGRRDGARDLVVEPGATVDPGSDGWEWTQRVDFDYYREPELVDEHGSSAPLVSDAVDGSHHIVDVFVRMQEHDEDDDSDSDSDSDN